MNNTIIAYNGRWNGIDIHKYDTDEHKNNILTYRMLADSLSALILCNNITSLFHSDINGDYVEPEIISGSDWDEESEEYREIYQYYIIGGTEYDIQALKRLNELVYYIEPLDLYIWGVDHWGTSWDIVSTGYYIQDTQDIDAYINDFNMED